MRAFGNKILVKVKKVDRIRSSGIIVPEIKEEKAQEGTIVSVGERVKNYRLTEGVKVIFGKFSTDGINSGLDILCLREVDILAVLENGQIYPLGRIMVKMIPIQEDYAMNLGPTLRQMGIRIEDKKKHWNHAYRRGTVMAVDHSLHSEVIVGDTIVFNGAAGFTLDGDIMDEDDKYDDPLKGESFRWLKSKEVEAIELPLLEAI